MMLYNITTDIMCNFNKCYFQKQIRERICNNTDVNWLCEHADKILDYKSWYYVSRYCKVLENKEFLKRYKYRLWWKTICKYQKLNTNIYFDFYDDIKMYWGVIIHSNNKIPAEILLSGKFPSYCWEPLSRYGNLSYETLNKVGHKIKWNIYINERTKYKSAKAIKEFNKKNERNSNLSNNK